MHKSEPEPNEEIKQLFIDLESDGYAPKLVVERLIGYHGTSKQYAELIIKSQHIDETKEKHGRLGRGAYFYENGPLPGPEVALAWAKFGKDYPTQAVVAAAIESEGIFDLTLPRNRAYFQAVLDWFVGTVRRNKPERVAEIRTPDIVRFILANCPERKQIQCVRWDGFRLDQINMKFQRGLAVREPSCIKKLWLYANQ